MKMMMVWVALASLAIGGVAFADPVTLPKPQADVLDFRQVANRSLKLDGVFEHILTSARIGIESGKIVLMKQKHGRPELVAATVGRARTLVGPAFDLSFSSASALMRVVFE